MKVKINNTVLNVENDVEHWQNINNWEQHSFRILDRLLNEDSTFVDVGAWNGVLSLYAAKRCKSVVAFEPDAIAFQKFKINIEGNDFKNIIPVNYGCSDSEGDVTLNVINSGDSQSSLIDRTMDGYVKNSTQVIHTIKLSEYLEAHNIFNPSLIKIDTEGAEIFIIPEMIDYLRKYKPTLYISFHPNWFPDKDFHINQLVGLLSEVYDIFDANFNSISVEQCIRGLYDMSHEYIFMTK